MSPSGAEITPVAVGVDAGDFGGVGVVQALRKRYAGLEGARRSKTSRKISLARPLGDEALAELALGVDVAVELVRVAGEVRVVAVHRRAVLHARRALPGTMDEQRPELAGGEGVVQAAGERQLIERVDPVGLIVEFPVGMHVHLLHAVVGAHAELNGHQVGLQARKVVALAGQANGVCRP